MRREDPLRFLLDEHVAFAVASALRQHGSHALHLLEADLGSLPDPALLRWCQEHGRILVTRNYKDFAPLVEMLVQRGEEFPGVLFLSSTIAHSDVGAHVRALESWLQSRDRGEASVTSTFGWLGGGGAPS